MHPWERLGHLGKAPFRYVGMEAQQINADGERVLGTDSVGAWITKPGGSCAVCGTYIVNMYNVESADGVKFHVGSDCILKIAKDSQDVARKLKATISATAKRKRTAGALSDRAYLTSEDTLARLSPDHRARLEYVVPYCGAAGLRRWRRVVDAWIQADATQG